MLADLKKILAEETKYRDGKVLSSMCTRPQPIAKKAHSMFLDSNLGDPGLFLEAASWNRMSSVAYRNC